MKHSHSHFARLRAGWQSRAVRTVVATGALALVISALPMLALRLTDISQMVGYDDQSYFTKVFKRTAGIAPGEYVKKYRGASSVRTPSSGQAAGRT